MLLKIKYQLETIIFLIINNLQKLNINLLPIIIYYFQKYLINNKFN
jgi:hypothetical protein